jgi:hypothetical protein
MPGRREPERQLSDADRVRLQVIIAALRVDGPLDLEQLASKTRLSPHHLKLLLNFAVRVNKVRDRDGVYEY